MSLFSNSKDLWRSQKNDMKDQKWSKIFCKKRRSYRFRNFYRKNPVSQSLFNNLFFKKRLQRRCSPAKFAKLFRRFLEDLFFFCTTDLHNTETKIKLNKSTTAQPVYHISSGKALLYVCLVYFSRNEKNLKNIYVYVFINIVYNFF